MAVVVEGGLLGLRYHVRTSSLADLGVKMVIRRGLKEYTLLMGLCAFELACASPPSLPVGRLAVLEPLLMLLRSLSMEEGPGTIATLHGGTVQVRLAVAAGR